MGPVELDGGSNGLSEGGFSLWEKLTQAILTGWVSALAIPIPIPGTVNAECKGTFNLQVVYIWIILNNFTAMFFIIWVI